MTEGWDPSDHTLQYLAKNDDQEQKDPECQKTRSDHEPDRRIFIATSLVTLHEFQTDNHKKMPPTHRADNRGDWESRLRREGK